MITILPKWSSSLLSVPQAWGPISTPELMEISFLFGVSELQHASVWAGLSSSFNAAHPPPLLPTLVSKDRPYSYARSHMRWVVRVAD